jgi:phospho-N-acetylmuramoyl-pentapeptide-transferase
MLYYLAPHVKQLSMLAALFESISLRMLVALVSGLILSLLLGRWFIAISQRFFRSKTREFLPERHQQKGAVPTLGGIFVLMAVFCSALLWCNLANIQVWIFLLCMAGFGAIGFWDDWAKIRYQKGISASVKIKLQWLMAALIASLLVWGLSLATTVRVPFLDISFDLGLFFIPWAMVVLVGTSNAVNLTDGLDGLAISSLIPNFALFSYICLKAGSSEVALIGIALVGASLGFLWYNKFPARIFMGDVGSLSLGAGLACIALMAKQELLLVLTGGVFVIEVLSVIVQVLSYKFLGRRLFRMAPLHHHFELLGWPETKITARLSIITVVLCLLGLSILILR